MMDDSFERVRPGDRRHPIHLVLVPIPIICFIGTLITDIAYWQTAEMMWADFSAWLVSIGVLMAILAGVAGIVDFVRNRHLRSYRAAWVHFLGNALAFVLAVINAFVHTRDAWTSVVPTGLILSAVVVFIVLFTGWLGWWLVNRAGVLER
jgi:uncharacterized membrane protein